MVFFLLKRVIGVLALAFGIVAIIMPVLPGGIFAFIGLELLGLTFILPGPVRRQWDGLKGRMWEKVRGLRKR
jgi:hypothetical protein